MYTETVYKDCNNSLQKFSNEKNPEKMHLSEVHKIYRNMYKIR